MTHWATGLAVGVALALGHALLRAVGLRRMLRRSEVEPASRFLGQAAVRLAIVVGLFAALALLRPAAAMPAALGLAGATFLLLAAPVASLWPEDGRP